MISADTPVFHDERTQEDENAALFLVRSNDLGRCKRHVTTSNYRFNDIDWMLEEHANC